MMSQREACRRRLWSGLALPLGFLLGTILGAAGFARAGYPVLAAPVLTVGALTLWAARRSAHQPDRR